MTSMMPRRQVCPRDLHVLVKKNRGEPSHKVSIILFESFLPLPPSCCFFPLDADRGAGVAVEGGVNFSMFSSVIDEGLELSQRLCESLFSGPDGDLDPEREGMVLEACTRLRAAVDKLLDLVSDSTTQVGHHLSRITM